MFGTASPAGLLLIVYGAWRAAYICIARCLPVLLVLTKLPLFFTYVSWWCCSPCAVVGCTRSSYSAPMTELRCVATRPVEGQTDATDVGAGAPALNFATTADSLVQSQLPVLHLLVVQYVRTRQPSHQGNAEHPCAQLVPLWHTSFSSRLRVTAA